MSTYSTPIFTLTAPMWIRPSNRSPVSANSQRRTDSGPKPLITFARGPNGQNRERYNLLTGTSVMLGSILRYPRLSMIQGCSRYGGNSSAAVLGNRTC